MSQTPSAKLSPTFAATSSAIRVFPTPPGPTSVTSADFPINATTSCTTVSRPMSEVTCRGKLCRAGFSPPARSVAARPSPCRKTFGRSAAASKAWRCSASRPSARTKRESVPRCGVLRSPRSSAPMPCVLICARAASSSWESPAARRCWRRSVPNREEDGVASSPLIARGFARLPTRSLPARRFNL